VAVLNGQLVESEKLKREFEEQNESLRSKISQKQTKINDLLTESAALRANLVNFEGIDLNEVQTIQKQNMEMRTKLMNMDEGTKEQTKGEYTKLLSQYENLNKQYSETVKENGNLQRRYNDLKTVCDSLQEQYDTLKKQRFEKSPSQPQGAREPGNLPPAIFAQNVETYQLMEKDDQNPTDSSQLNSYLVDRCREDVMKIKKTMLDKLEFQMVQKECAPAFKQLDTMLSQLKAQVNSAEGTSNGTGSSAQLAIEQAESQVVRAKSLADSLEARLQALEGQDTAELDNSAICLYKVRCALNL
jgi:predicted nuclease with TOPRIM domain